MAEIIKMPKLSDTMTEGVVAEWHKKVGDTVASGDLLADIETDKATMEFESYEDGVLLYIGVEKGAAAPVDTILAIIGEKGEDFSSLLAEATSSKEDPAKEDSVPQEKNVSTPSVKADSSAKPVENIDLSTDKIKISPLARRMAKEKGIDVSGIIGTGEGGRIVKKDIEQYQPSGTQVSVANTGQTEVVPVSQMRKTIAKRLAESKFSAPHFYLTLEIDMEETIRARKAVNEAQEIKVSFNDFIVKAAAMALKKNPAINASWKGDTIEYHSQINIGVAVAVDDGLLVPVVRDANAKSLPAISAEVRTFAKKAKDKKLQPSDWEGNTFSISNLGMYGIESFTAIINPPDACILAIGGIIEKPVVKNSAVVPSHRMKVTLSCDHRVVDGATGAAFLKTFKDMLEQPVLMMA